MTAVISKKAVEALSVAAFKAAYAMATKFAPRHTHDFIEGGVQHKVLSYSYDFLPLVKVTKGAKFKLAKRLPLVPALGAEKLGDDDLALAIDGGHAHHGASCRNLQSVGGEFESG